MNPNIFKFKPQSDSPPLSSPFRKSLEGEPPLSVGSIERPVSFREFRSEPLSDKTRQKREAPTALILAIALALSGMSGIYTGLETSPQKQKQKIEKIREKILQELNNPKTQKEGMQQANFYSPIVNEEIIDKLIEIAKQEVKKPIEDREDLIIKTIANIPIERQMTEEEIKRYKKTKQKIVFCLLDILEEENKKEIKDEKKIYRNNRYKNKIRDAIKRICNTTFRNAKISVDNFIIILDLSKSSDLELSQWAKGQIELLKENKDDNLKNLRIDLNNNNKRIDGKIISEIGHS